MKPLRQLQCGVIVKGTGGVTMAATPLICLLPLVAIAGGGVAAGVSLRKLKNHEANRQGGLAFAAAGTTEKRPLSR